MRTLYPAEQRAVDAILKLSQAVECEFAAFLTEPKGPLIEIRTALRPDGVDPSVDVLQKAGNGYLVCHHNHVSQESLSGADWRGLARIFNETWAYCADGTRYYGRVLDVNGVERILRRNYERLQTKAEDELFQLLMAQGHPEAVTLGPFFGKEVMCRAMLRRHFVAYEVDWGTTHVQPPAPNGLPQLTQHAGHYGRSLAAQIDQVAATIALVM